MNKEELYKTITAMVPVKNDEKKEFRGIKSNEKYPWAFKENSHYSIDYNRGFL